MLWPELLWAVSFILNTWSLFTKWALLDLSKNMEYGRGINYSIFISWRLMLDSTKVWNSEEFHYFLVMTKDDGKGYICSGCTQMYGKCISNGHSKSSYDLTDYWKKITSMEKHRPRICYVILGFWDSIAMKTTF